MLVGKNSNSFGTLFQLHKQRSLDQSNFTAALSLFLTFDQTKEVTERLTILYVLYAYYADAPLTQNPFLTFFLEFVDNQSGTPRANWIEQYFIYSILENSISNIASLTPLEVCQEPEVHIPTHNPPDAMALNSLKRAVTCLIDNPQLEDQVKESDFTEEHEENEEHEEHDNDSGDASTHIDKHEALISYCLTQVQNTDKLDQNVIQSLSDLLQQATTRTLTIPENEVLIQGLKLHPYTLGLLPLAPKQLPNLIELNLFLAVDLVPMLLKESVAEAYLYSLSLPKVTCNSLEVIHRVLTTHHQTLPEEFLHIYISNAIRTCELLEGSWQERQVKMLAKFLQSLLERHILPVADYMIEVQSFCLGYLKIRGVANLFRTVSHDG